MSTSIHQTLRDGAMRAYALLDMALVGLTQIAHLTQTTRDDEALAALRGVKAIIDAMHEGFAGTVTPAEARAALVLLKLNLSAQDIAADAALAAKFP